MQEGQGSRVLGSSRYRLMRDLPCLPSAMSVCLALKTPPQTGALVTPPQPKHSREIRRRCGQPTRGSLVTAAPAVLTLQTALLQQPSQFLTTNRGQMTLSRPQPSERSAAKHCLEHLVLASLPAREQARPCLARQSEQFVHTIHVPFVHCFVLEPLCEGLQAAHCPMMRQRLELAAHLSPLQRTWGYNGVSEPNAFGSITYDSFLGRESPPLNWTLLAMRALVTHLVAMPAPGMPRTCTLVVLSSYTSRAVVVLLLERDSPGNLP